MSGTARTTIMVHPILIKRVSRHVEKTGDMLTEFYNRAVINQLEKEGDWEIRDILEELEREKDW